MMWEGKVFEVFFLFKLGLWLKMKFIAMSMVSWNGILAGAEPEGYNLSYSVSLQKFICFNLRKELNFFKDRLMTF